jgi:hypothetical protein
MCERRVLKHQAVAIDANHTKTCRHRYIKATLGHKNKNKDEKNLENVGKNKERKRRRKNGKQMRKGGIRRNKGKK